MKRFLSHFSVYRNIYILTFFYGTALFFLLHYLYIALYFGGDIWQHGDWLINNEAVTVRRGLFGSLLFSFSRAIDGNPLWILGIFQGLLVSFIFGVSWYAGVVLKRFDNAFFLLISPFFLLAWALDTGGCFRKEMLSYCAMLPYLLVWNKGDRARIFASAVSLCIYLFAVLANEANVIFLPAFLCLTFFNAKCLPLAEFNFVSCIKALRKSRYCIIVSCLYLAIACTGFLYAFSNTTTPSPATVCQPILEIPGISPDICKGTISYLDKDAMHPFRVMKKRYLRTYPLINYGITTIVSLAILFICLKQFLTFKQTCLLYLGSYICFIPIFVIATDWGRYFNYHIFSVTFVALTFLMNYRDSLKETTFKPLKYGILLFLLMQFGLNHCSSTIIDYNIGFMKFLLGLI